MNKNTKRSPAEARKKRSAAVAAKTPPRSATPKGHTPITLSSAFLNSERLCWLLVIAYFVVGIVGSWTKPSIANPMLLKAIWGQIALSVILVLWCWQQRNNPESLQFSWPRLLFLSFMIWISITVFWSIRLDFYVFKWMMWIAGAAGFYLCLQLKTKHFSLLLGGIVLSAVIVALIAMAQVFLELKTIPQAAVPASTFGNKNLLGHFMVLSFPSAIYLMMKPNNHRIQKIYYSIGAVLILATIFQTTARGSWLAIGMGIAIMVTVFLIDKRNRNEWIKHYRATRQQSSLIALVALCLFIALVSYYNGEFRLFPVRIATELGSVVDTAQQISGNKISPRYMIWRAGLEMVRGAPLIGHGLGGFFENMLAGYKNHKSLATFRTHNDYLEIWIETGLVGLVLYLSCLLSIAYCVIYALKRSDYENRLMIICLFAGIGSSLTNGMFSFPLQLTAPIMVIAIYAAILIRLAEDQGICVSAFGNSYILRRILLIISISVASFVITINTQWWGDYNHINKIFNQKEGVYDPDLLVFHPEQISILWRAGKELNKIKRYKHSIEMMTAVRKRWPEEYNLLHILFNANKGLKNYREAIRIGSMGLEHGHYGLFGFYTKLFEFYLSANNKQKANEIYQYMIQLPEKARKKNPNYYNILIYFNLRLGHNTPQKHYQEIERLGLKIADAEKNMAFLYISNKNRKLATKHIKNYLELNPQGISANRLRIYLEQQHENKANTAP